MVIVMYNYDIRPDKQEAFDQWEEKSILPFWKAQPEIKSIRVLSDLFGGIAHPQRTVLLKLDSMADFEQVLRNEKAKQLILLFNSFTTNLKVQYLDLKYADG